MSILRLIQPPGRIGSGAILYQGRDLCRLPEREMQRVRGAEIALIFQEPMTALNPVFTIGSQIEETLVVHGRATRRTARDKAIELLETVQVPEAARRVREYPHQLSGGLRQRALIALSLACNPAVLIADEPTTALDVTIQAQILELLRDLQQRLGLSLLLITHDLGVVAGMADRVAVMYAGRIVEEAPVADLFAAPAHPYTRGLLGSMPGGAPGTPLTAIPGTVPAPGALPPGCCFTPRCHSRFEPCPVAHPGTTDLGGGHTVKCYLHGRPCRSRFSGGPETGANCTISRHIRGASRTQLWRSSKSAHLVKEFTPRQGLFRAGTPVRAVDDVSFAIEPGETFGLVGESGSGKTTTGRCILRLIEPTSGEVEFKGENVLAFDRERMRRARRDLQIVFQDPYSSLNPRMRAGTIVEEPLIIHRAGNRVARA